MTDTNEHLRGPWKAFLADDHGFVLDDFDDLDAGDEVEISIRRGSALPKDDRLPGTCFSGDVIELWSHLYIEDGDPSTDAAARWAQAQAMAAGLNAVGSPEVTPHPAGAVAAVTIERPDDEHIEVHVNGTVVASANYDEHGWSGMGAVERAALAVARAFEPVVNVGG